VSPACTGAAISGVFMVCYQVLAQFTFYQRKPALVSTHIKKLDAIGFENYVKNNHKIFENS
jgi:hypothetical protein